MRNCWTCKLNIPIGRTNMCRATMKREHGIREWEDLVGLGDDAMPPHNADGCPGYESSAPLMGAPEHFTAMHIPAPVEPQERAQTEAQVYTPPGREWDPDDDGRDCG